MPEENDKVKKRRRMAEEALKDIEEGKKLQRELAELKKKLEKLEKS